MFRALVAATILAAFASVPAAVSAHEGGHQGGCEDFGTGTLALVQDPQAFADFIRSVGIPLPEIRNLGQIIAWFASTEDSFPNLQPGLADNVATFDHLACGPQ